MKGKQILYAERYYEDGRLLETFYGLQIGNHQSGSLKNFRLDDLAEELQKRIIRSSEEGIYENFQGSEIKTSQSPSHFGRLLVVLKTGLDSKELGKFVQRLSVKKSEKI